MVNRQAENFSKAYLGPEAATLVR